MPEVSTLVGSLHSRLNWPVAASLLAMAALSAALLAVSPVGGLASALALAIVWVSLAPSVVYLASPDRAPIPFLPLTGLYYALFYGLPVFAILLAWPSASQIVVYRRVAVGEIDPGVLATALAGICSMMAAFALAAGTFGKRIPAVQFIPDMSPSTTATLLWVLVAGHLLYLYVPEAAQISSVGQFLKPAGYMGYGGLYLLWRRGRLPWWQAAILVGICVPLDLFARSHGLLLTDALLLLLFTALLFWRERQRKLLLACLAVIAVSVVGYGAAQMVRYQPYLEGERLSSWGTAIFQSLILGKRTYVTSDGRFSSEPEIGAEPSGRFVALTKRMSQIWIFHIVDRKTPEEVPYWDGETYRPLLTAVIPRILYPSKPEERSGSAFGQRYGFIPSHDTATSVNIPWMTELLANAGRVGVVLGMAVVGLFLAVMDRLFNRRQSSDMNFVFGLTMIFPLTYPESNFSLMTGSLPLLFLTLLVYFRVGTLMLDRMHSSTRGQRG